jgi:hypothetical protein
MGTVETIDAISFALAAFAAGIGAGWFAASRRFRVLARRNRIMKRMLKGNQVATLDAAQRREDRRAGLNRQRARARKKGRT